jgi:hypothetical protein
MVLIWLEYQLLGLHYIDVSLCSLVVTINCATTDTQQYVIQKNDTQHNNKQNATVSITTNKMRHSA